MTGFKGGLAGLLLALAVSGQAVELDPPEVKALVDVALQHAYCQEYPEAQELLEQVIAENPENPAGYFFLGALWMLYMFDMSSDTMEEEFDRQMTTAQRLAEGIVRDEENARAHLYLGAVRTYRAVYAGWAGKYWDAWRWGSKAPEEMSRALALDSTLDDARLALGVNEYFRYAAGRYIGGLNVFGSLNRALGLVNRSIEGEGYFTMTASYALAWIMRAEKRYGRAESILLDLLEEYPGNRMFRRLLRDLYVSEQDYLSAFEVGEAMAEDLADIMPDNVHGRSENWYALARSHLATGDSATCRVYCDSILAHELQQDFVHGLPAFVKAAKQLKKKAGG